MLAAPRFSRIEEHGMDMERGVTECEHDVQGDESLQIETPDFAGFRGLREVHTTWASVLIQAIDRRSALVATCAGTTAIAYYGRGLAIRPSALTGYDALIALLVLAAILAITWYYIHYHEAKHACRRQEDDAPESGSS
jgi:hypothetical protein